MLNAVVDPEVDVLIIRQVEHFSKYRDYMHTSVVVCFENGNRGRTVLFANSVSPHYNAEHETEQLEYMLTRLGFIVHIEREQFFEQDKS